MSICSHAAGSLVYQWDFTRAKDTLGWTQAEPIASFGVENGALTATAGPGLPKLQSPLFELEAAPWQYVEVELKTDTTGTGLMYYSNTTEPPYGGFRPGTYASFQVFGDNEWHRYTIRPFWHRLGKIIHIRLDPPGRKVSVRAVRIYDSSSRPAGKQSAWSFHGSDWGWQVLGSEGQLRPTETGLSITGDQNTVVMSPPLDIDADDYLFATLRIASDTEQTAQLRWVSDELDGIQTLAVGLKGDRRTHTYVLDLSDAPRWSGRILVLGLTPTDTVEARNIVVESITLGQKPAGPAEFEIVHLGLEYPIVRVGQRAKVVATVKNTGGSPTASANAELTLINPQKGETAILARKHLGPLEPMQNAVVRWEFQVEDESPLRAVCRIEATTGEKAEKSVLLRFYPKLRNRPQSSAGGVPDPTPADTSPYLVGCYYFPGWHTYERWSVLDEFPERKPVLGYYREGDPQVADWHIKWALEHGISFFIYDWYWVQGTRQLEHALHNGLFNSKHADKIKFCLLWANHNPDKTSSEEDCLNVTRYWIEHYFNKPNYLKVEGKNVVVIFSPDRLTLDMGSEAVRVAFEKMRKMCEDAGVGGLYLVACTYPGRERVERLVREGYDALTGYNYPSAGSRGRRIAPYEWMVEGYKEIWDEIANTASIPYIPVCEAGWDARPWHGYDSLVRTGKSPELWQHMLQNAKAFVDDPRHKQDGDKKLVFLEAWNEFGEGDYIEPHAEYGFDYLEAVRRVFAPHSSAPEIVVPPDVGLGPYELPKPEPKTSWDFSNPADQVWTVGNMSDLSFSDGLMRATARNNDPAFYSPYTTIDASKFKTVEIKMRMDKGSEAQIFFAKPRGTMSEAKSVRFPVIGDGEWHVYTVDMSQNKRWQGKIGQIRIDPNSEPHSRVEVAYVKLR
ncbi:MAG: glycoside hydrolase family 99-like domain-containing protein [Armatimonadota bacterium]|nr:glycoside hydrolase family 99-like domain-containing protein [Armatimonadota bacterium]